MKYLILFINLILLFQCSRTMKNPIIEAIDSEFNQKNEYGFQYFEISHYEKIPTEELISYLKLFADDNISQEKEEVMMFFYRKKAFTDYSQKIYESANENDFGGIFDHEKDLIAKIWFTKNNQSFKKRIYIYDNHQLKKEVEYE